MKLQPWTAALLLGATISAAFVAQNRACGDDALRREATAAIRKAAGFYRGKIAVHGGLRVLHLARS